MNESYLYMLAALLGYRVSLLPGFGYGATCGCGDCGARFSLGPDAHSATEQLLTTAARMRRGAQA